MSICLSCDLSPLSEKARVHRYRCQRTNPSQSVVHDLLEHKTRNCQLHLQKRTDDIERTTVLFEQEGLKQTLHAWLTNSRNRCEFDDGRSSKRNRQGPQGPSTRTQTIEKGFEEVSASGCCQCPHVTREPPLAVLLEHLQSMKLLIG